MYFEHRWAYSLCVSAMLISLGYMYDVRPSLVRLRDLEATELILSERLLHVDKNNLKASNPVLLKSKNQFAGLHDLINKIHENGLSIVKIQPPLGKNIKSEYYVTHFIMEGNIQNIYYFIESYEDIISVKNFSIRVTENNHIVLAVDILLRYFYDLKQVQNNKILQKINPFFCYARKHSIFHSVTQTFPLKQMKMVGCFHQGNRQQALILLPNQALLSLERGAMVGSERAIVSEVHKDYVLLKLPNEKFVRIEHDISGN